MSTTTSAVKTAYSEYQNAYIAAFEAALQLVEDLALPPLEFVEGSFELKRKTEAIPYNWKNLEMSTSQIGRLQDTAQAAIRSEIAEIIRKELVSARREQREVESGKSCGEEWLDAFEFGLFDEMNERDYTQHGRHMGCITLEGQVKKLRAEHDKASSCFDDDDQNIIDSDLDDDLDEAPILKKALNNRDVQRQAVANYWIEDFFELTLEAVQALHHYQGSVEKVKTEIRLWADMVKAGTEVIGKKGPEPYRAGFMEVYGEPTALTQQ